MSVEHRLALTMKKFDATEVLLYQEQWKFYLLYTLYDVVGKENLLPLALLHVL